MTNWYRASKDAERERDSFKESVSAIEDAVEHILYGFSGRLTEEIEKNLDLEDEIEVLKNRIEELECIIFELNEQEFK